MKKIWIRTSGGEHRVMAAFANNSFTTLARLHSEVEAKSWVAAVADTHGLTLSDDGRSAK